MRLSIKSLAIFLILLALPLTQAQALTVKLKKIEEEKEQLLLDILTLALSKTGEDINFAFDTVVKNEAQMMADIETGEMDIMWAGASQDKDENMLAVRIPALKGLLGHRIFIIREQDKGTFKNINTLNDLKQLKAGQGRFWGDSAVLKSAQIPLVTTTKFNNLFSMLEGGRFDYFPRAVHEPWVEVNRFPELNLVIDENVMLIYPFAMYFYVKKDNQSLHDLIYNGFNTAIEDGSFDDLFFSNPMIQDVLTKANLKQRTILRIDNPALHADTPLDKKADWLDVSAH